MDQLKQTALADLHAFGAGMLQRYAALIDAEINPALVAVLTKVVSGRHPLIEELARCERVRGDQPKAANQAINELRSAADRLLGYLFGPQATAHRVLQADKAWADRLNKARELSWHSQGLKLLRRLEKDVHAALESLPQGVVAVFSQRRPQ